MKGKIKVLVVDDERYARDELKHLLTEFSSIDIVGEADTGESAVVKAVQHQPDVVFLDVEMPRMGGMEAAKSLRELKKAPLVVFATAYPQFAAEAFRYEAVDYLLKPYDEEQLQQTVDRLEKRFAIEPLVVDTVSGTMGNQPLAKLAVEADGEIVYIGPKDILYIYREEKVSKIVAKPGEFTIKTPLKELERRLLPFSFFRIHKGYLVNLDYVEKLSPWFNGAYQLELKGTNQQLSVSRNYVKPLRQRLEL